MNCTVQHVCIITQVAKVHVSARRIIAKGLLPHTHVYVVNACAVVCLQHIYSPSAALYCTLISKNQSVYVYDITVRVHHIFIRDR